MGEWMTGGERRMMLLFTNLSIFSLFRCMKGGEREREDLVSKVQRQ